MPLGAAMMMGLVLGRRTFEEKNTSLVERAIKNGQIEAPIRIKSIENE